MNRDDRVLSRLSAAEREAIAARHSTVDTIAAELGVGRRAVRRAGIVPQVPRKLRSYRHGHGEAGSAAATLAKITPAEQALIESQHSSLRSIAPIVGVSIATLSRAGWKARLPNRSHQPIQPGELPADRRRLELVESYADLCDLYQRFLGSNPDPDHRYLTDMVKWAVANGIDGPITTVSWYAVLRRVRVSPDDFYARFGADLPPGRGRGRWNEETIMVPLTQFVREATALGGLLTIASYDRWRLTQPAGTAPSRGTILASTERSWHELMADAVEECST